MKLRNKKTGEIIRLIDHTFDNYNSLAELSEEWEEYEEMKVYWFIDCDGTVCESYQNSTQTHTNHHRLIGNYFETKEEAEQTVEKLKAWKRLKYNNLRVERGQRMFVNADNKITSQRPLFVVDTYNEVEADLDLLFGGEE